ncbi:MAG: hypothetical protein DRJ52_02515 [Thermoprotei archaeon]|nr:MAG: hypothetical protein DRJ52_02515 [Thermoprotei archaeon]RLF00639.1 MAG: hypothetical protein DRJ63_01735 [Thermoprotei archaeon]
MSQKSFSKTEITRENVRYLVYSLLTKDIKVLKPVVEVEGIYYPDIGNYFEVVDLLEELASEGYLKRGKFTRIILCPNCNSHLALSKYLCPNCGSFDVERIKLVMHVPCGHIDVLSTFKEKCPTCGEVIRSEDLELLGEIMECNSCKARFDEPAVKHYCLNCGIEFTHREAIYERIYEYEIVEQKFKELEESIVLNIVRSFFEERGFSVKEEAIAKGASGLNHVFSFLAIRENKGLYIDVKLADGDCSDIYVRSYAKYIDIRDVNAVKSVLLVLKGSGVKESYETEFMCITFNSVEELRDKLTKIYDNIVSDIRS